MGKRHNASRFAYSDTDEPALLKGLLPEFVNLYATYHIRQWRYDNRLRLLWLQLGLCLWLLLRLWRCPCLCLCRLLIFSTSLEFQFKILAAEKGAKFLVPEFLLANPIIKIGAP